MKYLLVPAFKFLYAVFMTIWWIIGYVIIIGFMYTIWYLKLPGKDFLEHKISRNPMDPNDYSPYFKIPMGYQWDQDAEDIKFKTYLHFLWGIKEKS